MRRNELIRMHSLEPHISMDFFEWHVSHVYVCLRFGSFDFFQQQRMQVVAALVMRGLCPRRTLKMQIICFQVVLWYLNVVIWPASNVLHESCDQKLCYET